MRLWHLIGLAILATFGFNIFLQLGGIGYRDPVSAHGKIVLQQDMIQEGKTLKPRYRLFVGSEGEDSQFLIEDDYWRGIIDSGSLQSHALLNNGKECEVHGIGRRIPLISAYPIVTSINNCH